MLDLSYQFFKTPFKLSLVFMQIHTEKYQSYLFMFCLFHSDVNGHHICTFCQKREFLYNFSFQLQHQLNVTFLENNIIKLKFSIVLEMI